MALIAPIVTVSPYPVTPIPVTNLDYAYTASTPAGDTFAINDGDVLLIRNVGVGARTFTLTSQVSNLNRLGNITAYSVAAGLFSVLPLKKAAWVDSSGLLNATSEDAEIEWALIRPTLK